MPEILTESFCERCGTRYTFESAAPRAAKLKGIRVLSRGLKNFVMSDDSSMDEAMAAARSETDREQTSQQLDAFHKTFNFCMTCRQYTCSNCWNEAEGRCLTCAPHLGHEILPAPFPALDTRGQIGFENGTNGADATTGAADGSNGHASIDPTEALAWPTMDLEREAADDIEEIDASARLAAIGAYGDGPPVEADTEPVDAFDASSEAAATVDGAAVVESGADVDAQETVAAGIEVDAPAPPTPAAPGPATIDPADVPGRAAAAAAQTTDLLRRFRPGQSLDAEIEAYEREQRAAEPVVAAVPAPEPEPEPVVAEVPAPPPAAAEDHDTSDTPAPSSAREDVVSQPTWHIVAPDAQAGPPPIPPNGPPASPDAVSASAEPQWPAQPEWPSQRPTSGLAFLGRPALPTGGLESLWAESAREVTTAPTPLTIGQAPARGAAGGVQPCVSCGLSLSATARFCRRCGTPQG